MKFLVSLIVLVCLVGCASWSLGLNHHTEPLPKLTPFQQDVSTYLSPIIWVCFLAGAALIGLAIASIFTFAFLSTRTAGYCGAGCLGLGLTLLWLRDFVVAHPWVVPTAVGGVAIFLAWPFIHRWLLKAKAAGAPDTSTPLAQLKSIIPGLGAGVPTLSKPTTTP